MFHQLPRPQRRRRRRWHGLGQLAGLSIFTFGLVGICLLVQDGYLPPSDTESFHYNVHARIKRNTELEDNQLSSNGSTGNETAVKADDPLFPKDLFTLKQRQEGALILHILGMIYMFIALAIVCDEFFVPALDVIIEKAEISEDVAGATFMAAGGSAPELFTSVIGVFISFDDVGIGTIVGSAVFNILFVIAMCVLFSKTVLDLTWWPLFRDVFFYSIALLMLVLFFRDNAVYWYEALALFFVYFLYCTFMVFNAKTERAVKNLLNRNKVTRVCSTDQLVPNHAAGPQPAAPGTGGRRPSQTVLHNGTKFRQGLLQLMIHTIDPLHDGKVDAKATQLHAIASLKVLLDATKPQNGRVETYRSADGLTPDSRPDAQSHVSGRSSQGTEVTHIDSLASSEVASQGPQINGDIQSESSLANNVSLGTSKRNKMLPQNPNLNPQHGVENNGVPLHIPPTVVPPIQTPPELDPQTTVIVPAGDMSDEDDENKPIDLSWPDTTRKRIIYVIVAPLIFPLWITLPDTRTVRGKKFFFITFLGSITWIAVFSYLMVWWATVVGNTINIPPEVMGLTILAAGTSVPDLITSVIVARKGFGDMAVSSSVGSNLFDVTVGLPIPWLLFAFVQLVKNFINGVENPWSVAPIQVNSAGMACTIFLLFAMLMFVIISIGCSKWKMKKGLGFTMFFLYFIFVIISLSIEYDVIECPRL